MARIGINRETGEVLTGWAHCAQSISTIINTVLGSLLMARDFGSDVPNLIDRPMSKPSIVDVYMAITIALQKEEPGFKLLKVQLVRGTNDGVAEFETVGDFYPNGHLGDFSVVERGLTASTALPGSMKWVAA